MFTAVHRFQIFLLSQINDGLTIDIYSSSLATLTILFGSWIDKLVSSFIRVQIRINAMQQQQEIIKDKLDYLNSLLP